MASPRRRSVLTSKLDPLRPGAPRAAVLDELRRTILDGDVPPHSAIPVDDVAARFGVSRIPVREALMTLIGEGLVDHQPHSGYHVAQLTADELRELYVVRRLLETAALAAAVGLAHADDHARAKDAYDALDVAVRTGDSGGYHRESRRFHMALLAPARMRRLQHVLESAWNVTEPSRPMAHVPAGDRRALHAEHGRMLSSFVTGDTATLLQVSAMHHQRLEASIAALPRDRGLFAEPAPS